MKTIYLTHVCVDTYAALIALGFEVLFVDGDKEQ